MFWLLYFFINSLWGNGEYFKCIHIISKISFKAETYLFCKMCAVEQNHKRNICADYAFNGPETVYIQYSRQIYKFLVCSHTR